ncbi:isocitrate/isopropylmalate dehydrogenase family protein [Nocardia sp. NPDC057227]|uniref:isocitrate/isopropylmalate dehydrogenase family protein n=1 Tax=Nocardia sp. NPDC057227 TaxID=3346056 RepID=UPI0036290B5E
MSGSTEGGLRLGVLDGDGIGPEVVAATTTVVDAALAAAGAPPVEWVPLPFGRTALDEFGDAVPERTLRELERLDAWILGPHDNASYPGGHADPPSGRIRRHFRLFANIRPARAFPGVRAAAPDIDLVIVRENTEGFYADRNMAIGSGEFAPTPDVALSVGLITRAGSTAIAHEAFRLARARRGHLTIVHKANVLPLTMGLFRSVCYEIAAEYPEVAVSDEHVDAAAAHLVRAPADYDVLVTENLFGDILSDLAGELSGSLGIAPSVNCSARKAMAQAVHGAAPDIAGRGIANPVALQGSAALLLRRLGERGADPRVLTAAGALEAALGAVLAAGVATPDLGGTATTSEFTGAVERALGTP